jgi:hypothetical protein
MPGPIAVHRALSGVCYPAAKSDLIARAQSNATDPELMNDEKLPDKEYDDYDAVQKIYSERGLEIIDCPIAPAIGAGHALASNHHNKVARNSAKPSKTTVAAADTG